MFERTEDSSLLQSIREEEEEEEEDLEGQRHQSLSRYQSEPLHRFQSYNKSKTTTSSVSSLPLYHWENSKSKQQKTMSRLENWGTEPELGKRRKRSLAGKVKANFSKPARAVGRRVFKNRYGSKDRRLEVNENVVAQDSTETIFRQDEPMHHRRGSSSSSILRRSLSRMMSAGSLTNAPKNNLEQISTENRPDDTEWPVRIVEALMRNAALLCGAYVLGASHPEYSSSVVRSLEFLITAWLTCLLILVLGWMRKSKAPEHEELYQQEHPYASGFFDYQKQWLSREGDPEITPLIQQPTAVYGTSTSADSDTAILKTNSGESAEIDAPEITTTESFQAESCSSYDEGDTSFAQKQQEQESSQNFAHPKLASFYVVDSYTGERIMCNTSTPYHISNEWMEMDMLAMIRTPDADDADAMRGTAYNKKVSEHFRGHARRFEFQYQVKLKKKPEGKQMFFSCELDEPIKMGIVTKAFVSAAMAFVKSTNPNFHYNITGSKNRTSDGKYETAHTSFTCEGSLDRFVVTKPGETPPKLGGDIDEDPEAIKRRKGGELTDWNTEDTYTMSIWSSYVDFLLWRVQKVPGIKPFGLASVLGTQPINLTMYLIDADVEGGTHYRKDIHEVIKLELSNGEQVGAGKEAKKWIQANLAGQRNPLLDSLKHSVSEDSVEYDERDKHPALGSSETMDEMEEMDKDTADAAELGEGIYLRSGDSVLLREFLSEDEKSTACTVVNGGGFAVLSKRNIPVIIEKTRRSRKNKLIKSGDTVMFKMIQNKAGTDEIETRYLTIHRGWWLKWVTTMPSKNGYFTIFTHETELGEKALPTDETQSSFLTLGGSFYLRHKRWSRYGVGISAEPSTDFGGRMLSLYNSKRKSGLTAEEERHQATYQSEDDGEMDKEMPSIGEVGWIKPLVLCAQDPQGLIPASPRSPTKTIRFDENFQEPKTPNGRKLLFSSEHSRADVPAWIELMDRGQRVRQLAYVVRIVHRDPSSTSGNEETFARLKSGKNLARIMNIGQSMKIKHIAPKPLSTSSSNAFASGAIVKKSSSYPSLSTDTMPGTNGSIEQGDEYLNLSGEQDEGILTKRSVSSECLDIYDLYEDPSNSIEVDEEGEPMTPSKFDKDFSTNDDDSIDGDAYMSDSSSSSSETNRGRQRRNSMQKLKKLGKKTGRITKKTAKGTTKLAAKGLRGTGKATGKLKAQVSRKTAIQPRKEPRKKNKESQSGIARKMKKLGKIEAKSGGPPIFIAGALSATEQSRRTASRILARMSSVPKESSATWQRCNNALVSELGFVTDQDTWFLDGDATQLGVKPSKKHEKLLGESVIARCLWESHWREEWCGMYESSLSFYTPLARSTCHEIFYSDILTVRSLTADSLSPLPGFPILVIETAWQCHYMAFRDEASRDAFGEKVDGAVMSYKAKHQTDSPEEKEWQKARFWQGFQTLSETSLASGAAKWAKVSCNQKSKERAILNGRRMAFDSLTMSFGGRISKAYDFVEKLLTTALTFSLTTLEQDPESFINFLDMTSELRFLPLDVFDLSSQHTFCMFVNIYHCLLQQALLLSVNGPLHKKSISHFMRTSCYEIGGDVFSLAELHSCVICGNMSKPINPKPPYVEAPKKSNAYKYYALDYTDTRVHFVLNTADMACPASIPVLSQRYLEQQLNVACVDFFRNRQLSIDAKRRVITMPKVCEIRRNDFSVGEIFNILRACVGEMDEVDGRLGSLIRELIEKGEKGLTIKFQHTHEQYHSSLKLTTAAVNRNLEMEYHDGGIVESKSMDF